MLLHPPMLVRDYINQFMHEPADDVTLCRIKAGLKEFYPDYADNVRIDYDYNGYLCVFFVFDTEEDVVIFKLKHGT